MLVAAADAAGVQAQLRSSRRACGVKLDVSLAGDARKLLLVLLPMVLIGTALLTLIAAGAKSVKEAQSYMSVLMLLPMIPTIMLMVNPVKNQLWMFAVPFLAQNQMILKLVRSEAIPMQEWAVYLAAGFGAGAGAVAGWRRAATTRSGWRSRPEPRSRRAARKSPAIAGLFLCASQRSRSVVSRPELKVIVRRVVTGASTGWNRQLLHRRQRFAVEHARRVGADHARAGHRAVGADGELDLHFAALLATRALPAG